MMHPWFTFKFTSFVETKDEDLKPEDYQNAVFYGYGIIVISLLASFFSEWMNFNIYANDMVKNRSLKIMLYTKNFRMASTGKRSYNFAQVLDLVDRESQQMWGTVCYVCEMI